MEFNSHQAVAAATTIANLYAHDTGVNVVDPATDTQVLVERMATGAYAVIFPGTASVQDWRTDLKIAKAPWCGHRVHRGFAAAYESVHTRIRLLIPIGSRIVIAGHSLGGAMATLAALRLGITYSVEAVYTFGSPRVGNGGFARAYNAAFAHRTFRVVNSGDPVPHIPWCFGTYRHVNRQVYLDSDGSITVDQPLRAAVAEATAAVAAKVDAEHLRLTLAAPHSISSYIQKLNQNQNQGQRA